MKYEMRVVAFIDILGFRGVLDETVKKDGSDDEAKIDAVIAGRRIARIKRLRLLVQVPYTANRSVGTAEAASKRLGQASQAIEQKVYRRRAQRVKPLR